MNEIQRLYDEWLSLQPLKPEYQQRLDQKFMLEFNYNSNHIEGNTLTYGQTEMLLLFDKAVDDSTMKDLEEMKAHSVALKMVQTEAKSEEYPLTETFIRELHKTLIREDYVQYRQLPDGNTLSYTIHAGIYKKRPNSVITVTGERFEYASPEETPALMKDLVEWYNEEDNKNELTPIELASVFHYRYIRIHPFEDGNGRIARLIFNYILIRHNYPMIVVESKNKDAYLTALNRCDSLVGPIPSDGAHAPIKKLDPFIKYMEQCLVHALTICIKAAKGENINEEEDFEKKVALLKRNAKRKEEDIEWPVSTELKADVYNNFHRLFANRLFKSIAKLKSIYQDIKISYILCPKEKAPISKCFLELGGLSPINLDNKEVRQKVEEAEMIYLEIKLSDISPEYKIKNHTITIMACVIFYDKYYTFDNKNYHYKNYPSEEDKNELIEKIQNEILERIKQEEE